MGQKSLGNAHVKIPSLPDLERKVEVRLSPGVPLSPSVRAAVVLRMISFKTGLD